MEEEKWYFSVVDIVAVLTENDYQKARTYWKVLKLRLKEVGKFYSTDIMDIEQILQLVQSIPSKKAEPLKFKSGLYHCQQN